MTRIRISTQMFLQKNITFVELRKMIKKISYGTMKNKIKSFLFQRYENEIDRPKYGTKCWSVYCFKKFTVFIITPFYPSITFFVTNVFMLYTLPLEIEMRFSYYFNLEIQCFLETKIRR